MNKSVLLGLPLVLIAPLLLLVLGLENANITTIRAACTNTTVPTGAGGTFGIGTLNWRGASHYQRNPHPGERPYTARVPNMVAKIGAAAVTIVGFQEFEPPQAQAFLDATAGNWAIVPGRAHGAPDTRDAIAYQPSAWTVAETRYVTINYGGNPVQIPLVRFTPTPTNTTASSNGSAATAATAGVPTSVGVGEGDGAGAGSVWVLNTHNPADVVNGTDAMRDDAVRAEAEALRQLQTADPATPLFLTGDMNDRARFWTLFLTLAGAGWSTANPTDAQIDWIMGSPGVAFTGTVIDTSTNDSGHSYTDHPFVHTAAQLPVRTPSQDVSGPPVTATPTPSGPAPAGEPAALAATPPTPEPGRLPVPSPNSAPPTNTEDLRAADEKLGVTAGPTSPTSSSCTPCVTTSTEDTSTEDTSTDGTGTDGTSSAVPEARPGTHGSGAGTQAAPTGLAATDSRTSATVTATGSATAGRMTEPTDPSADTSADPSCTFWPLAVAGELSAELAARVDAMLHTPDGLCALSWTHGAPCTWDNQCPKVVDALYGGPGVGRGYGNGQDVAQGIINAGLARAHGTGLDPLPPVGAVVSYNTGNGTGHVAIYVGNTTIFGNDYGCTANGVYGCVGFADVHAPGGTVTWALPKQAFDLGGTPQGAA